MAIDIGAARKEYSSLLSERSWWDSMYRDLSDYFQPWRSRFLSSDTNRPKRNNRNARNRALLSVRVARAGLMGGLTPQARPWFALTTPDPEMAEFEPVKEYLYDVQQIMFSVFARSNIYDTLHESYGDDITFGISSLYVEDDPFDLLRGYVAPIGSFVVANSSRMEVDTWYHRSTPTVRQVVDKFGLERCSERVRSMYKSGNYQYTVEVIHAIRPRSSRSYGSALSTDMPWSSCWFEHGDGATQSSQQGSFTPGGGGTTPGVRADYLAEGGYREFPVMCSRWEKVGEDSYGRPPSLDCLGAARGLQKFEDRRLQALDKFVNPPMNAPSFLRTEGGVTLLPGETNYYDAGSSSRVEPAFMVDPRVFVEARNELRDIESQIDAAMYVDLFLLIANDTRSGITAEEIRAKKEERLLQVGPTIQRIQREKLKPLIDRAYAILLRRGELPPAPVELSGVDLGVTFVAPLAAAQRAVATDSIERVTAFAMNAAKFFPAILDNFNEDEAIREYSEAIGSPPGIIRTEKAVEAIRIDRQQADQAKQMAEMAKPIKDAMTAAKMGAETVPEEGNMLANIAGAIPASAPPSAPLPPALSVVGGRP